MSVPNAPLDGLEGWGELGGSDVVTVEGGQHRIHGWIAYDDEWVEYLLDDGTWLCVEDDHGLRVSLWVDQAENPGFRIEQDTLVHQGESYRLDERYSARWTASGVDGLVGPGTVRVADYVGPRDLLAALEDWGDGPELSLGRRLTPASVHHHAL